MNEKEAARWKETFIENITDNETYELKFPTFQKFLEYVNRDFKSADRVQEAMNSLQLLKQGNRNVEELVTEFRLLSAQAGLETKTPSNHIHLIGLFQKSLNPALAKKILFSEKVPTTIKEWTKRAIQYDTNYRIAMAILGKPMNNTSNNNSNKS